MLAIRCIEFSSAHAKTYWRQLKFQGGEIPRKLQTRDCSVSVDNTSLRMGNYWLLKTEPDCWSWENQTANKGLSVWDGVRNHQAQKAMRNMADGDLCFFYHTGKLKEVCGIVRVVKTFYPDPTDDTGKWGAVDVQELLRMKSSVKLAQMKEDEHIVDFLMFRQPRLSVVPVEENVWRRVCALGEVEPPLLDSTDSGEPKEESGKGSKKRAPEPKPKAVVAEKQEYKRPARGRKKLADDGEIEEPAEVTKKLSTRTKPKPMPTAVFKEDEPKATNGKKTSLAKSKTIVNGNGVGEKAQPVKAGRKRRNDPKPAAAGDEEEEEEEEKKKTPSKAMKKRASQTKVAPAGKPSRRPPPKKSKKAAEEIEVQSDSSD